VTLLVLDRDGVVNEDSDSYVRSVTEWHPIPGSLEAIVALSRAGYTIAIATNQSGLGRGYLSLEDLEAIHARLYREVEALGGHIGGIFYCPHRPDEGCRCRKPATGMLEAIERAFGESPRGAIFIGDSVKDLLCAAAYGCRPVLVKTGKGRATLATIQAGEAGLSGTERIPVYDDLAMAARAILSRQPALKGDT